MNDTRTPVPIELLKGRSATTAYLAVLRDLDTWAEQAADVNRVIVPQYADLLDRLRDEIRAALNDHEMGTPATISGVVAELLGEA
jgi:hypothetical protein